MIIVTGCAGFIGYHVCKLLISQNYKIIGLDNLNHYYDVDLKLARLNILKKNKKKFIFAKIDLANRKKLENLFKNNKIKYVIHLAAQAGVRYSIFNPDVYYRSNIQGFQNILDLSKKFKVFHFVFSSSSSVYGDQNRYPIKENSNTDNPLSFYAATKKSNEILGFSYSNIYKLPITVLRLFTVYGPYGRPDMAPYKFVKAAMSKHRINLHNKGNHFRDFTYIDDVAETIVKVIKKKPRKHFQIYNVCSSNIVSLKYFVKLIEKILGIRFKKKFLKKQEGDVYKTYGCNKKLIKDFLKNYKFTKIDEGMRKFIEWYRSFYV